MHYLAGVRVPGFGKRICALKKQSRPTKCRARET